MQYIYQGADALCRTYTRALTLENLCQFGSDLLAIWLDGWWGDSKKSVLRRPGSLYSITSLHTNIIRPPSLNTLIIE